MWFITNSMRIIITASPVLVSANGVSVCSFGLAGWALTPQTWAHGLGLGLCVSLYIDYGDAQLKLDNKMYPDQILFLSILCTLSSLSLLSLLLVVVSLSYTNHYIIIIIIVIIFIIFIIILMIIIIIIIICYYYYHYFYHYFNHYYHYY